MTTEPDPILTVSEVAAELRVSRSHAHNLCKGRIKGVPQIPHLKLGSRKRVVLRSVFEKWKRENLSRES